MVPKSLMCISTVLISRGRFCRVRDLQLETGKKVVNYEKYMPLTYLLALSFPSCRKSGSRIYSSVLAQLPLEPQDTPLRREMRSLPAGGSYFG